MNIGYIVFQSAGSLSVAALSLIMTVLQIIFLIKKPTFRWFAWSGVISLSSMAYAVGVFLEYNTLGPVNRFAGLLEFTAIIFLIHSIYGFTFTYLELNGRRYHIPAGIFHCLILAILWLSNNIVSDRFVAHNFKWTAQPFIEPALGPAGPVFELYGILSVIGVMTLWIRFRGHLKHRKAFLFGMAFWIALGIHDGLTSMGILKVQYFMEYGFFGFSIVVLWVVFSNAADLSVADKYRVITEFANDGILIIQDGKMVFANPACAALTGRPVTDTKAEDFLDIVAPEDREKLVRHYSGLPHAEDSSEPLVIRIRKPGHEERIAEIRESVISYGNRPAVLAVMRDITERIKKEEALKESEEKLYRLKKMESLGLMAGGVAHDLNNVLSEVVNYPEVILHDLPEDSEFKEPFNTILESGRKASAIVEDMLTMARGVAVQKEPLNFNMIIRRNLRSPEFKKLLQHHPSVRIRDDLAKDLFNITGSPVHIAKTVMNLLSNAFEAVEGVGEVVISTMNRYLDRPLKGYDDVKAGEYAVMSVEDNGAGISPDDLERIFEPFFTKKTMGRSGTGLGLTVVWNIVQDHNGYIDIITGRGGTKFELYFPVTREAVTENDAAFFTDKIYGNGETILVIDDVKSQRDMICMMLNKLNYRTKPVAGGEEAVDYLKDHKADLLLLDMIMDPGIDGYATYERIRKIRPGQRAIIMSGFAETDNVKKTLEMGAGRFLKKPLIMNELGMAVKVELMKR